MSEHPDILLFVSDQHNGIMTEYGEDKFVSTPWLNQLAEQGCAFMQVSTSCPLCVPARMSMLTGQRVSKLDIFTNEDTLSSNQATIAHSLGAAGYETILCGRMHFNGPDQFHGFAKRLVGDFTPCIPGRGVQLRTDLGPYIATPAHEFYKLYGGGNSPVLEYDRAVINAALEELKKPHTKPIFMVIGTYGPHHTFVAPPELYKKYYDLIEAPNSDTNSDYELHPVVANSQKNFEDKAIHCMRAAYYGMIENIDQQIGSLFTAWQEYLEQNSRKGVFCYTSDHGEQAGEKKLWGKMTFYEDALRIPLVFVGDKVAQNVKNSNICSIMDLAPTLCELADAPTLPELDGESLVAQLQNKRVENSRYIISELCERGVPAKMVRYKNWKFITYFGYEEQEQLFDLEKDPHELYNCIASFPELAESLRAQAHKDWNPIAIIESTQKKEPHCEILAQWGREIDLEDSWRWKVPESSWELPSI